MFLFIWFTLLFTPLLAVGAFALLRRFAPCAQSAFLAASVLVLGLVLAAGNLDVSFIVMPANVVAVAVAYLAYCGIVVSLWRIPLRWLRMAIMLLAAIPIACGYVMGTIGGFPLTLFVADKLERPNEASEDMGHSLICTKSNYGHATTSDGYRVELTQRWAQLPYLERRLEQIFASERRDSPEDFKPPTCADVLREYRRKSAQP